MMMPEPNISPLSAILLLGVAQALFLGFALLTVKKGKISANTELAAILIIFAGILFFEFLDNSLYGLQFIQLLIIGFPLDLLLGPLIWIYVRKVTGQGIAVMGISRFWHFVPFIVNEVAFIPKLLVASDPQFLANHPEFLSGNNIQLWIINDYFIIFAVFQIALYMGFSLLSLRQHRMNIGEHFSYKEGVELKWLRYLLVVLSALYGLYVLEIVFARQFHFLELSYADVILNLGVVATIYALGFLGIRQSDIFASLDEDQNADEIQRAPSSDQSLLKKYAKSSLSAAAADKLCEKLKTYMEQQKPHLDNELTLPKLASLLDVSANKLSQVINEHFSLNFFDFVNSYRIEEAKKQLTSLDPKRYTILGVALDSGFNSKSAFYTGFKKHTAMTPTQFRKQQELAA